MTGVIAGEIIASKKVIRACKRHLRDLNKARTDPAYPWAWDEHKAARPIRFMEEFLAPSKGDYDHMTLMGWECFVLGAIFGWVDRATGLRRFREALILVARGNGKSTLMSGTASYLTTKDGERGADVYLLANSKEQASIVYDECRTQILTSSALRRRFRPLRDGLYYDATASRIQHRSADSKRLDGLSPHGAIFDELHAARDYALINVIKRGTNKRRQPLIMYITTMGQVLDGPLAQYYTLFSDAMEDDLLPGTVADRLFCFIAELDEGDDVNDTSTWGKANPSLGVLLDPKQLADDWDRAKRVPSERADFINKQLNIMTDTGDAGYVDVSIIDRNKGMVAEDALIGMPCYGGYDLSTREDFTAAALLYPLDDGRVFVKQHSWVTRRKVLLDQEKIPYMDWAERGLLTIVEEDYISDTAIFDWFVEHARRGADIRIIGYDPANAVRLNQQMIAHGFVTDVVRQGALTLSDPLKELRTYMLQGHLVINADPMMRWYIHNVRLRNNPSDRDQENWVPTKRNKYRKIDGFAAMLDAWVVWARAGTEAEVQPGIQIYKR